MGDLIEAVRTGDRAQVETLLSQNPACVRVRDEHGNSPVMLAIYTGRTDLVMVLTRAGAQLSVFEAAASGTMERLRALVEAQPALLAEFSHDGWTPLHLAAHFGQNEAVNYLLERGASVKVVSENGIHVTPLQSALSGKRFDVARLLLEHGADPNDNGAEGGYYPLHYAAAYGSVEAAEMLLAHGARKDVRNAEELTPAAMAAQKGFGDVAGLLAGGCAPPPAM
jgi:uncharacterized protein